ncbi:hypothetical protein HDU78_002443 [Chytriomyces hyalinus]|nr:hypothetical protein HDU78_002443 [Chytriomyces hyalinus]
MAPAPKHIWKPEQVTFMLDELLLQVVAGKRSGQTVKKEAWAIVMARFMKRFHCTIDVSKMKSKALKATEQKSAWDIVKFGLFDFKVLSELFEANLATGDLAKGSNENHVPDPDPQDDACSDRSSPFPADPPPPVRNPFAEAVPGRSANVMGTPVSVSGDSVTPVTNRLAAKRSAQTTAIGEHSKQSHTVSAPSSAKAEFQEFNANMKHVMKQISSSGSADGQVARFGNIPPEALLVVQVSEKLNVLLTACKGEYDSETCKWLNQDLMFKYDTDLELYLVYGKYRKISLPNWA